MTRPLRIFISHSSDDTPLAKALAHGLQQVEGVEVLVDFSGLEAGKPWRRQLHEMMARCGAGIVLLTQAVLDRPKWVLKEAVILGWRLDIDPGFSLFFVLAPDLGRRAFEASGFDLAQLSDTQLLPGNFADLSQIDTLVARLRTALPAAQPTTPFDELTHELSKLLRLADPPGATYDDIAAHLKLDDVPHWGAAQFDLLAERIACGIVHGRDHSLSMDRLIDHVAAWSTEHRLKLVNLLMPFWIDAETASALLRRAPPGPAPRPLHLPRAPMAGGANAVTIAGAWVPEFTAEMTVRRAFGTRLGHFRMAQAVGLGGSDLFDDIRAELCAYARLARWVMPGLKNDDQIVQKLRDSAIPVFAPLGALPDAVTVARLSAEFPRVVFLAPRPLQRAGVVGDELMPDPDLEREKVEHEGWEIAMTAIANG